MPRLDPIDQTNRQTLPLATNSRTKALGSAEAVRATEAVPGSTDNDADSWRAHLRDGVASAQEGVAHALARLAAFGDAIDPNGFSAVTSAQAEAGYAFAVVENAPAANAYLAGNETQEVSVSPSGSLSVAVRTPRGVDARAVVIDHRRGQNLVATYPRTADDWDFLTQPDGSPHYSYWKLVDGGSGSTIGISGVQAGDSFVMRVHDATAFEEFIVDQLPDVAGREDGNIVVLRRHDGTRPPGLYELETHPGDYYEGLVATSSLPEQNTVRLDQNPEGTVLAFNWTNAQSETRGFALWLRQSWFSGNPPTTLHVEATHYSADGSAIADNNAIAGSENTRFAISRDPSDDGYYDDSYVYAGYGASAALIGLWRGFAVGGRIRFKIYTDSGYTTELVDATTGHWNRLSLSEAEGLALQAAVADIDGRLGEINPQVDEQISGILDKVRGIGFDEEPLWAAATGNANGADYGKVFIGDLDDHQGGPFEQGIQYSDSARRADEATAFNLMYTMPDDGYIPRPTFVWALPNGATWDHLRLVVRNGRTGAIRYTLNAQTAFRNVPTGSAQETALNLQNIPDGFTVRATADDQNVLRALGQLYTLDTLTIETLSDHAHTPRWDGELAGQGRDDIDSLRNRTRDLHSGPRDQANWQDASQDSEGGLWASSADDTQDTQASLEGATWAVSLTGVRNQVVRVRVPKGTAAGLARLYLGPLSQQDISELAFLGNFGAWDYYSTIVSVFSSTAKLQVDANRAIGTTKFGGILTGSIEGRIVEAGNLAEGVAMGIAETHRFPAWLDEVANLNNGETFTNRGWLIPNANRWNVTGSVSTEDGGNGMDWLRIDAAGVLGPQGRGAQGVRVILTRGTPAVIIGSVFIPFAMFRSISGDFITGGGHGQSQGIAVGMWDPSQRNSAVYAECRFTDGRFLIRFVSANAGQSATRLTIYTAG